MEHTNWKRTEVFIEGMYYPKFDYEGPNWCYTVYPIVRPKYSEPVGFSFAGWARTPDKSLDRMRMQGEAKTVGECTAICIGHLNHVINL